MKAIFVNIIKVFSLVLVTFIFSKAFGTAGGVLGFILCLGIIVYLSYADILFFIGTRLYNKDAQTALKLIKPAYKSGKLLPERCLTYAYLVLRNGDVEKAESLINKITYLNGNDLSNYEMQIATINNAYITWKKGDIATAIEMLEEIYDEGNKTTLLYEALGYMYILNMQYGPALTISLEGYTYNSKNVVVADNLANTYLLTAEYDKAEEIYKKLLRLKPEYRDPYYNYACLMQIRGNKKEAVKYYNKALKYEQKCLCHITDRMIEEKLEDLGVRA